MGFAGGEEEGCEEEERPGRADGCEARELARKAVLGGVEERVGLDEGPQDLIARPPDAQAPVS